LNVRPLSRFYYFINKKEEQKRSLDAGYGREIYAAAGSPGFGPLLDDLAAILIT